MLQFASLRGCLRMSIWFACACMPGMQAVVASTSDAKLYWGDNFYTQIERSDTDGANSEVVVNVIANGPSLFIDSVNGHLYWDHFNGSTISRIYRSNLDGSNTALINESSDRFVGGITLDYANNKLYWTNYDSDEILRSNLDGSSIETVISSGLTTPEGITIDPVENKLYWVDGGRDWIRRSDLDGGNVETVLSGLDFPSDIELDAVARKIYWVESVGGRVMRSDLDGQNSETLVQGLTSPQGIAILPQHNQLFFSNNVDSIIRTDLDGGNPTTVISGQYSIHDVAVFIPEPASMALLAVGALVVLRRR